jgi:hypothetical protein
MKWTANEIAIVGVAASIVVAIISGLTAYLAAKREGRRQLYGEAVQAIVTWREMVYRVRRRDANQDRELIGAFHDLQSRLSYYEAWMGSESKYTTRSYCRLVKEVKTECEPLIQEAWKSPVRSSPAVDVPTDRHPNIHSAVDNFLKDVRSHLSPLPWRKLALGARNTKGKTA